MAKTLWTWLKSGSKLRAERQEFEATLAQLATRDINDTIAEKDLHLLMAMLEQGQGGSAQAAR